MVTETVDTKELFQRYSTLSTEVSYLKRKREEEAKRAYSALQRISDSDAETLLRFVPKLGVIRRYTQEDILANANNEVENIVEVYNDLCTMLDKWLKHYEGALC